MIKRFGCFILSFVVFMGATNCLAAENLSEDNNNDMTQIDAVSKDFSKNHDYHIIITKHEFKLRLYDGENLVKTFPIACGRDTRKKMKQHDCRTPEGDNFSIQGIWNAKNMLYTKENGRRVKGVYGPWFLHLKCGYANIGIHGTGTPSSIGHAVSHGCIRLHNSDITELHRYVKIGTKVRIIH